MKPEVNVKKTSILIRFFTLHGRRINFVHSTGADRGRLRSWGRPAVEREF
jgi:hypothetical protein